MRLNHCGRDCGRIHSVWRPGQIESIESNLNKHSTPISKYPWFIVSGHVYVQLQSMISSRHRPRSSMSFKDIDFPMFEGCLCSHPFPIVVVLSVMNPNSSPMNPPGFGTGHSLALCSIIFASSAIDIEHSCPSLSTAPQPMQLWLSSCSLGTSGVLLLRRFNGLPSVSTIIPESARPERGTGQGNK
jgi:hypothetical protein